MATTLVLGASGFLGSHVTKALVAAGREVRIMVRASSDTSTTDHLAIERVRGDIFDPADLAPALEGVDVVYYCVVDTRAWLTDPTPLYEVNVEGLRKVMDQALEKGIQKFVYTSTFGTLGRRQDGPSTEADEFNWRDEAPDYILCRVDAEDLFLRYCREKGLPGVACCIGNTYGADDAAPTPHGKLVWQAATGRMPMYWDGGGPSLGIEDAADGMLLAEEKGRVGERYAFADRYLSFQELFETAALAAGEKPRFINMPIWGLYTMAFITEKICRITGVESPMNVSSIKCATMLPDFKSDKARQELGWQPGPVLESVRKAVGYYLKR